VHDKKHPVSVWLHCLSWALGPSGRSEPGVIPTEVALRFGAPSSIAKLVAVGLWTEIDDGYRIHDFAAYSERNDRSTSIPADSTDLSAKRAEAGRKGGLARVANQANGQANPQANDQAQANGQANQAIASVRAGARVPDPDPDHNNNPRAQAVVRVVTGERLAADGLVDVADRIAAKLDVLDPAEVWVDLDAEIAGWCADARSKAERAKTAGQPMSAESVLLEVESRANTRIRFRPKDARLERERDRQPANRRGADPKAGQMTPDAWNETLAEHRRR
jgi:hypothetical protein